MPPYTPRDPRLFVLVVEDHPDGADALAELLGLWDYRVTVARTGAAALRVAAADPPDVVLLDLLLPDLDGWEVARRLVSLPARKRPLVVAVSGCGRDADRRRSAGAGVDLHLVKPVAPLVLRAVLGRFARVALPPPALTAG